MIKKKRIEAGVFLAFIAFVSVLSVIAFKVTDSLHQDLEQVMATEVAKERLLNDQIRILSERRILIRDIALADDPFQRDELIQLHAANANKFLKTRNQLLALKLSDTEQKIFDSQIELNRQGYQAQLNFINALIADEIEYPGETILNDIHPLLWGINARLIEQKDLIISVSDATRKKARERYEEGWVWVLLLYISSLIFTGLLTYWIYNRQKTHQSALEYQATHDALTGLSNRLQFERELQCALDSYQNNEAHSIVLYMDLDQFKLVNDTSGHVAGDVLLKDISGQMRHCVRSHDLLARLGGDEFGVLLLECGEARGREIAEKIRQAVADYRFEWEKKEFSVGVSIGLVALNGDFEEITDVMSAVDVACYIAKDHGRNQVHVYTADDVDTASRHGEMHYASQIRQAISSNRFQLYYQDIRPLNDARQQKKVEILLRMDLDGHQEKPDAFILAAERYNLMPQVDRWVVSEVLRLIASGSEKSCLADADTVCINLSGTSISDPSFMDFVIASVDGCDLKGKHICFEITESAVIAKLTRAITFITELRKRGFSFALDDFGKGLSSYTYLKQLPVDYLKIDGSFVANMKPGSPEYVFVQSMNTVGKALGLQTIAEWVESEDVYNQLQELGVDFAQGYYLGKVKNCSTGVLDSD